VLSVFGRNFITSMKNLPESPGEFKSQQHEETPAGLFFTQSFFVLLSVVGESEELNPISERNGHLNLTFLERM
jgi:hypothetical protein